MEAIVYDTEIVRCIPPVIPEFAGLQYCRGWTDYAGMGISVIGAYDYAEDRYRIFLQDNLEEFQKLLDKTELVVGYNTLRFDNPLLAAHGLTVPDGKNFDLLARLRAVAGAAKGLNLNSLAEANFGAGKTDSGALAPVKFQLGERGAVFDYCLADVWLTKRLFDKVLREEPIIDPRTGGHITLRLN